jgi:hypothetical protein
LVLSVKKREERGRMKGQRRKKKIRERPLVPHSSPPFLDCLMEKTLKGQGFGVVVAP